jgi:hypothetical protein
LAEDFVRIVDTLDALSSVAVSGLLIMIKIRYGRARLTSEREHGVRNLVNIADAHTKVLIASREAV